MTALARGSLVAATAVLCVSFVACAGTPVNASKTLRSFEDSVAVPRHVTRQVDDWTIAAVETGSGSDPQVVFIHGAPGSLDAYARYFERPDLASRASLISIDRPGYGDSEIGRIETSIKRQAELVVPFIRPGAVIVGHSYGGTLAARIAMDYPDLPGALVLVAPAVDPENERIFFFNQPLELPVFNWLLTAPWRVSNAEKTTHIAELEKMVPLWADVRVPVTLIHGTRDSLVPFENVDFVTRMMPPELLDVHVLEGENHFILWSQIDLIAESILGHLNRLG